MMMLKPRPALPSAHFWRQAFCAALMFWGAMATSKAQVYKWVDANGQAHYSERRLDAGAAKTTVVKIASAPAAPPNSSPSTAFLRAKPICTALASGLWQGRRAPGLEAPQSTFRWQRPRHGFIPLRLGKGCAERGCQAQQRQAN